MRSQPVPDPSLNNVLDQTVDGLRLTLGVDLRVVALYGSHARGTATPDSDVDLLVIVTSLDESVVDRVSQVLYEVMWQHDFRFILSPVVLSQTEHQRLVRDGYSLTGTVEREGIKLWPKAA